MLIKVKKTWKDYVEGPAHKSFSRRDFLIRGLATSALSVVVPNMLLGDLMNRAMAASAGSPLVCPPTSTVSYGCIAQIFANGGPTMGARFLSDAQAALVASSTEMASNYGITGKSMVRLGPNMNVDSTSPFGMTLLQGPPGYVGGAAAWKTNVLSKISGGGHLGQFNADDGAGQDTGLIGAVSPFMPSQMGKDINIGVNDTLATWANGLPASSVSGSGSPSALAETFTLTPAATGLTNSNAIQSSSNTANDIARDMASVFNTTGRKAGSILSTNAGCALNNNVPLANPTYGSTLFTPTGITALTSKFTVSALSTEQQAQVAAMYQSAMGVAGGVKMEFGGRDYHGQSPQAVVAPADIEDASAIVMFLAACDAAQQRGTMIYLANGQAISAGTSSVSATIFGTAVTVNSPVPQGDAGGAYNAGLAIFYDPKGAPPPAIFTGTVNSSSGNATINPNISSSQQAVAGLYLSALQWNNNGSLPPAAVTAMQAAGVAATPANILLF